MSNAKNLLCFVTLLTLAACATSGRNEGDINMYSVAGDAKLGQYWSTQVPKMMPLLFDDHLRSYVDSLGQKIVHKFEDRMFDYHFNVVKDAQVNAFAIPGGYLYVNLGLLQVVEQEAELAMVMGHEMGHVVLRHGTEQLTKAQGFSCCLSVTAQAVGLGQTEVEIINLFGQTGLLYYGRKAELEADKFGVEALYLSKYSLDYAHTFFEKLLAIQKHKPNLLEQMLSTHPKTQERIEDVRKEVQKYKPILNPTVSSEMFWEMKKLLQKYPNKYKQSELKQQFAAYKKRHGLQ
ncbi:MAG: hypothetical protein A3B70_07790 [Deltaproteobacteria bacterium RIFCSPHIGHO2_02_FULL_40_11]|nr:MAG: hypothetical protein A3B70_07790 [Deltaproteobacteria bacterium RIFCSPHIGHO2_02_FULL_40_11]